MFRTPMLKLATLVALFTYVHISDLFGQGGSKKSASSTITIASDSQPLSIGSKMPDLELKNIINFPKKSIKISEFRGKLLVLDFWSTSCASCIQMLRHVNELEHTFKGKVKFMPITYEDSATVVKKVFERLGFNFPTVVNDLEIKKIFPHKMIPHYIWINEDGIIQAITGYKDMTEENISKILNSRTAALFTKNDFQIDKGFSILSGLLPGIDSNLVESSLYISTIRKYDPSLDFGQAFVKLNNRGMIFTNVSIQMLYLFAYNNEGFTSEMIPYNRCVIEGNGKEYITASKSDSNFFSYNLAFPTNSELKRSELSIMKNDLKSIFGLNARWEKRNSPCYILTCFDSVLLRKPVETYNNGEEKYGIKTSNVSLKMFAQKLDETVYTAKFPVIDETNINGNFSIDLLVSDYNDFLNMELVNKKLSAYGLKLMEADRIIDMLILSEK